MTITLYLQKASLLKDLRTLNLIFSTRHCESIERLKATLPKLTISTSKYSSNNVSIQVTAEEFAAIGIFNNGI